MDLLTLFYYYCNYQHEVFLEKIVSIESLSAYWIKQRHATLLIFVLLTFNKCLKQDTANVTTQILPYVHEAFEIATGRLGNGTNLRKV